MTIIIVGAGQAAGQAAASLRQEGYEDRIVVIGDEAVPPYQRPPLSKQYLSGEHDADKIMVRPAKFYKDRNIELRLGQTVTAINRKEKLIEIANESIGYEKLLISTGSRPRKLNIEGSELGGIFYLRTKADVDDIRTAFSKQVRSASLAVAISASRSPRSRNLQGSTFTFSKWNPGSCNGSPPNR